jgi:hypothetical protein
MAAVKYVGKSFADHQSVNHGAGEYVRDDVHTNTVEGYFSIFKRGFKGIYQHCGEQHLHRYLAEYDFRYNNRVRLGVDDEARAREALKGAEGKRRCTNKLVEAGQQKRKARKPKTSPALRKMVAPRPFQLAFDFGPSEEEKWRVAAAGC